MAKQKETKDYWRSDPAYPVDDWQEEVRDGDTRLGYWDWVKQRKEQNGGHGGAIDRKLLFWLAVLAILLGLTMGGCSGGGGGQSGFIPDPPPGQQHAFDPNRVYPVSE